MPLLATARVDQAVADVFNLMLGLPCTPAAAACAPVAIPPDAFIAAVDFTGCVRGQCTITLGRLTALRLTAQLLGFEPGELAAEEQHEMLADAVGELCNMIAGGWKSRLNATYACCALTPPRILTAAIAPPDLPTHARFERCYGLFDDCLAVEFHLAA